MVFQEQLKDVPDAYSRNYEKFQLVLGARQQKISKRERQYGLSHLDSKEAKLTFRVIRKSNEINDLMYYYQNMTTVREELAQLNHMSNLLEKIHEECL